MPLWLMLFISVGVTLVLFGWPFLLLGFSLFESIGIAASWLAAALIVSIVVAYYFRRGGGSRSGSSGDNDIVSLRCARACCRDFYCVITRDAWTCGKS